MKPKTPPKTPKLWPYDLMVAISGLLMLGTRFVTQFLIAQHQTLAQSATNAQAAALMIESNPIAKWLMTILGVKSLLTLALPALLIGGYFVLRRKKDIDALLFFTTALLFFAIYNFLNDLGVLLGFYL